MKIKTRESLNTIKTFDRADMLAQKSKTGVSLLHNSAEQTQGVGYESETEYAGNELQDKEERLGKTFAYGANRVGKWGVREARRNILKWHNRPRKTNANLILQQLPSPQRKALQAPKKGMKSAGVIEKYLGEKMLERKLLVTDEYSPLRGITLEGSRQPDESGR